MTYQLQELTVSEAIANAVQYHREGALESAESLYRQVLAIEPDNPDALHLLGLVFYQQGNTRTAMDLIDQAIAIKQVDAAYYSNRGQVRRSLGDLEGALVDYRQALALEPDLAHAHFNLAKLLHKQGYTFSAIENYLQAQKGGVDSAERRLLVAEVNLRRAVELMPDDAEAHINLGNILFDQGRFSEAEGSYRRALELKPDNAEAHINLGSTLLDQGRLSESEVSLRLALALKPKFVEVHNNLGVNLRDQGRPSESEVSLRRALALQPENAVVHCNLGAALRDQGRLSESEVSLRRALMLQPENAIMHCNLGATLVELGRLSEAESSYRRSLVLNPDNPVAYSNLLLTLNLSTNPHPPSCIEEARSYGRMVSSKAGARFYAWQGVARSKRLRVGLVSGDLRSHPVGYFLESVLANIDPDSMMLIAYPTQPKKDDLTARLRPYFSTWKPLFGMTDEAAANLIHDDGVHVLLDISGHTDNTRLPVFAWKPAPVQASWLGYFATTGLPEMDYLLGDPYVTPPEEESHFTEKIWRLPERFQCFTPPDVALEVVSLPALSAGCITFGCFNNLPKINEAVIALWTQVLQAVPGSRLFLKAKQLVDPTVCKNTRRLFANQGITFDRLMLEGGSPRADYLAAYNKVDIALDPFPYPGGTTSVEGLWMGVPVITRRGDRFLSHMGESIAHNAGLADWIAADDDDYVTKAIAHTSNLKRLATLRAGLRQQMLDSPLCDAPRFARHFEAAIWGMWHSSQTH